MALDIGKIIVESNHNNEVVRICLDLLRPINTGLQKGITEQNMGLIGQQQTNLALVYGILAKLDEKMSGKKSVNTL